MSKVFTDRQNEIIKDNLNAFIYNFCDVRIEKAGYGKGFLVFSPSTSENWIQHCYDIHYLNGWLYGCVQTANGIVKPITNE